MHDVLARILSNHHNKLGSRSTYENAKTQHFQVKLTRGIKEKNQIRLECIKGKQ